MIGIEIDDTRVTAVALSDAGIVQSRATAAVSGGIETGVRDALTRVRAASGSNGAPVGIAAPVPDAIAAAVAGLPNVAGAPRIIPSGSAAAVAESWVGAAKGTSHVVFFAVGDRTTGGVVRHGAPMLGARGRAMAVAWMSLNPVEREDYRKIGCLEAEVAGTGIVRRLVWRIKAGDRSRVQDIVKDDLSSITVAHVLEAARGGDGVSISVMRDTAKYLGMAAANLAAFADPEALVLGGLMASAADLLLEPVRTEIGRRLPRAMLETLTIVPAALGDDAPAIGAARIAASGS